MRDERSDDSRPEDDQAAIDRAFAELVADFHRSPRSNRDPEGVADDGSTDSERPGPPAAPQLPKTPRRPRRPEQPPERPNQIYGFRLDGDAPLAPQSDRRSEPADDPDQPEERYVPPPAPPLTRPNPRMLVGWLAITYAIVAMLLLAVDVPLPRWAGWFAILAFLGGLALLLSQLPRHRPPDDDDGARL